MKSIKIVFTGILAALLLVLFVFTPIILAVADEVSATAEISSIFDEETSNIVSVEESIADSETFENTGVLDEEAQDSGLTLDELTDMLAGYLESKKADDGGFDFWSVFKDSETWIIATFGSIGGMVLTAFFASIWGHFKNKGVINTEKNVETIAAKAAADAVKGIVGQSINLDISAEVNKAVEKFMYAIKNELDSTFDMAKNTEILAAEIALALSKSRVLTKEEQTQLKGDAKAVMAHAQKGGVAISAPATVVVSETKEEVKTVSENVKTDNGYTLNFGGV